MKKLLGVISLVALGACTYGNPVNNEQFFSESDITAVDWTRVNATGMACQTNVLYMIPFGDNSLPAAVENGNLSHVAYVDTDTTVYPFFSRECTNVWGTTNGVVTTASASDYKLPADASTSKKSDTKKK